MLIVNRGKVLSVHDEHRCDLLRATTGRIVNIGYDAEVVLANLRRGAREGSCDRVEYEPVRDYVSVGLLGSISDCRTSVDYVQIAK